MNGKGNTYFLVLRSCQILSCSKDATLVCLVFQSQYMTFWPNKAYSGDIMSALFTVPHSLNISCKLNQCKADNSLGWQHTDSIILHVLREQSSWSHQSL